MKKAGKRVLFGSLLLVVLMFTMTFTVFAARDIPKNLRVYPNQQGSFDLTLNECEYIKITSAKGLNAKIIYEYWSTKTVSSFVWISYKTKKAGDYKLVFNIYDALTNKKKTSATINIYAYDDYPIKQFLVNGEKCTYGNSFFYLNNYKKSNFTFKVQMNSGYKLKKLEYVICEKQKTTTKKNGNMTETITENPSITKTFKNGGSVPISKYGNGIYLRDGGGAYNDGSTAKWHEMRDNSRGPVTQIRITYVDKYTKNEVYYTYYVYLQNN